MDQTLIYFNKDGLNIVNSANTSWSITQALDKEQYEGLTGAFATKEFWTLFVKSLMQEGVIIDDEA